MTAQPRNAVIGDNSGAAISDAEALRLRLAEDHAKIVARAQELLAAEARIPDIVDDDTAGRASDYVRQVTACSKALELARVGEKEPFLESAHAVDGFFNKFIDALAPPSKKAADCVKRRVLTKLDAYLLDKADRERRLREDEARQARMAAAKAEADAMALAEKAAVSTAEANEALDVAVQAGAVAAKAEKAAAAKPADLARTRGDFGSLATLRREWTFKDLDRDKIDLEALRQHLSLEAIERALRSFIKAGGREIAGAVIFEDHSASVR